MFKPYVLSAERKHEEELANCWEVLILDIERFLFHHLHRLLQALYTQVSSPIIRPAEIFGFGII